MARKKKTGRRGRSLPQEKLLEVVHEVWLAGIGAVTRAQREGPKVLEQLLREGSRLYATTRGTAEQALQGTLGQLQQRIRPGMNQARAQAGETLEALEKVFQTRVHRALAQLGVPSSEEIAALGRRVDALNANVERLAGRRRGTASRRAKRAPARKGRRASAA